MSAETLGGSVELEPGLQEKCGVFGIIDNQNEVAEQIMHGLLALQHRGQQAAGMTVFDERRGNLITSGAEGLVQQVFTNGNLDILRGAHIGIGHTRYGTVELSETSQPYQPFHRQSASGYEFAIAHNGNLVRLFGEPVRANAFGSDTEQLANHLIGHSEATGDDIVESLKTVLPKIEGAYSFVIAEADKLTAVRDPNGYRPLFMGRGPAKIAFASETGALNIAGADKIMEVDPGEIISVNRNLEVVRDRLPHGSGILKTSCIIEPVYFAHENHTESGESTMTRRIRMGYELAREYRPDVDAVSGVPGTALPIAKGYSEASGVPQSMAITKNPYLGRAFIESTPSKRQTMAKLKFQIVPDQVEDKRLLVIDDSIVRGTNTKVLVEKLRRFGAREVHFLAASPPYRYPCHYGVDTGRPAELLANRHEGDIETMRIELGLDSLGYLSLGGLMKAINIENNPFCTACLTGDYPTPVTISS